MISLSDSIERSNAGQVLNVTAIGGSRKFRFRRNFTFLVKKIVELIRKSRGYEDKRNGQPSLIKHAGSFVVPYLLKQGTFILIV